MACCSVDFAFFTGRPAIIAEDQKDERDHSAKLPATFRRERPKHYADYDGSNWDQTTE
jgi:hypothetical protein